MTYPVWEIPYLGGGLLIALIATLHVILAHFAVGGSLFLVLVERKGLRSGDPRILSYLRRHARFFLYVTLVPGAVSGVGIWFTIGLISPWATSALIKVFVWVWAIEWSLFLLEIVAALIYYYGWDHLTPRAHQWVGWVYFGSAWGSLAVINGILTFMLTPGQWLETRSLADGYFNPSMLPSLFLRTLISLALAGLFGLLTASRLKPADLKSTMVRYSARWLLPSFLLLPVGAVWLLARIPAEARNVALGENSVVLMLAATVGASVLLFLFAWLGPYRAPHSLTPAYALLFVLLGCFATGSTEWVREAVRKPFLIHGYMYSNGFLKGDETVFRKIGILGQAGFALDENEATLQRGREIFRLDCESCHTIRGVNGIARRVQGWSPDYADQQLQQLDRLKGFMPPFIGNPNERKALALWLTTLESSHAIPD